jgi:hypothetical protein
MFSQLEARYGAHGFAIKSRHCTFSDLIARGHSNNGIIVGAAAQTLQCSYISLSGILVGVMKAGDTGAAVVLANGNDETELHHIALSNLVASGVRVGVEFRVRPGNTGDLRTLALNNLTLDGNNAFGSAGIISTVSGAGRVRAALTNVTVSNFETGYSLGGEFELANCAAEDCQTGVLLLQQHGQTRWRNFSIRNAGFGVNLWNSAVHYLSEAPKFTNVQTRYAGAGAASGVVVLPQHWRMRSGPAAVVSTSAERSLLEASLNDGSRLIAPTLLQSQTIRLRAGGTVTHAGAPAVTFRVKLGTATLATVKLPVANGSQKAWSADLVIQTRSDTDINPGYPAVTGTVTVNNETVAVAGGWVPVNLSIPAKVDLTVQWDVGSAANSIQSNTSTIEVQPTASVTLP